MADPVVFVDSLPDSGSRGDGGPSEQIQALIDNLGQWAEYWRDGRSAYSAAASATSRPYAKAAGVRFEAATRWGRGYIRAVKIDDPS